MSVVDRYHQHHIRLELPPALTITICGGGNGAHTTAVYLSSKPGLAVNVLTRQPERWSKELVLATAGTSWEGKGEIYGLLNIVTSDPAEVIPQSDLVIIASPAHTHPPILQKIAPYLNDGSVLGSIYCQGGFDWAVRNAVGEKVNKLGGVWGLLNIPWICNAPEYGHRVRLIGPKKLLKLASYPAHKSKEFALLVSSLFDIPCTTIPNFLTLTLTPSNQIIHPARYYGLFKDWDGHSAYQKEHIQWGLYSELDECSAEWLQKLDDELQSIKFSLLKKFPHLDLTGVLPIKQRIIEQYGPDVKDTSTLVSVFQTNLGYAGCRTPAVVSPDGNGFLPNVKSRLFWEDIPFGLCILKSIAQMLCLPTPTIDFMIRWHQQFMDKEYLLSDGRLNPDLLPETAAPEAYGIHTVEELVSLSLSRPASRL